MYWAALLKGCLKAFTWIWDMKEFQSCLGDKSVHRETRSVSISQQCDINLTRARSQRKLHTAGKPLAPASSLPCLTIFSYWPGRRDWKAAWGDSQLAPGCLTVLIPAIKTRAGEGILKEHDHCSSFWALISSLCLLYEEMKCLSQPIWIVLCSMEGI